MQTPSSQVNEPISLLCDLIMLLHSEKRCTLIKLGERKKKVCTQENFKEKQ